MATLGSNELKSQAIWLFVQHLVKADNKENIKGLHYWSLVLAIYRMIPLTKGQ